MMGHPDLRSDCDINQLEPLLPQDVVDDLLSKYVKTFTVNPPPPQHTHTRHTNKNTDGCPIPITACSHYTHFGYLYLTWTIP